MGTVSQQEGAVALGDADVTVAGRTPAGAWRESAKTGSRATSRFGFLFATDGPIEVLVVKGDPRANEVFDSRDISTQLTPKSDETKRF